MLNHETTVLLVTGYIYWCSGGAAYAGEGHWGLGSAGCVLCGMLRWNYDIRRAFYVIKYDDSKCLRGCGSEWCQRVSTWLQ